MSSINLPLGEMIQGIRFADGRQARKTSRARTDDAYIVLGLLGRGGDLHLMDLGESLAQLCVADVERFWQ